MTIDTTRLSPAHGTVQVCQENFLWHIYVVDQLMTSQLKLLSDLYYTQVVRGGI